MDESLTQIRHERSKKDFPGLKLEADEYVEFAFKRARVCLGLIFAGIALAVIVILLALLLTLLGQSMLDQMGRNFVYIILSALFAAAVITGVVALMLYHGNQLFITNKRVIQKVMDSPVANSTNIIDLASIEDASFHQKGIMPTFFHYGTLRLATVGDETTYTFKYSDISSDDLKAVTKLITSAKRKTHQHNTQTNDDSASTKATPAQNDGE